MADIKSKSVNTARIEGDELILIYKLKRCKVCQSSMFPSGYTSSVVRQLIDRNQIRNEYEAGLCEICYEADDKRMVDCSDCGRAWTLLEIKLRCTVNDYEGDFHHVYLCSQCTSQGRKVIKFFRDNEGDVHERADGKWIEV